MTLKNKKFSLGSSITVEGGGIFGLRKGSLKSGNKKCTRSQSLHETQPESPLNPSFSSEMSLSVLREQATAQENLERSDELVSNHDFIKHNKSFHKLFPEIPEGESVAHAFTCSLQKEVLYHGKLFVSQNHVCFYSSVLLKDTKVVIPVSSIKDVKKHNSALSVLSIKTAEEKYSFVSLRSRELCYKLLQSVRAHAQAEGANSSPHFSSAENEPDHDLLSSYSSLEDRVDLNLTSDSLDASFLHMSSEGPSRSNSTRQNSFTDDDNRAGPWIWRAIERLTEIKNLRILFHIYVMLMVLLLLVTGYIGLRILALQEQLNSLGALTDWSSHHRE